jgi:hypothetical protein
LLDVTSQHLSDFGHIRDVFRKGKGALVDLVVGSSFGVVAVTALVVVEMVAQLIENNKWLK